VDLGSTELAEVPASHGEIRLGRTSDFDELSRAVEPSLALAESRKAV
jgi:hypothetical protein